MTPGARIKTLADLLTRFYETTLPADVLLLKLNREARFIGSNDRQFFGQHFFSFFRHKGLIDGLFRTYRISATPLGEILAYFCYVQKTPSVEVMQWGEDSTHAFGAINSELQGFLEWAETVNNVDFFLQEQLNVPEALMPLLEKRFGDQIEKALHALNEEAPLDLRVNTLKAAPAEVMTALQKKGLVVQDTPHSPIGGRLSKRILLANDPLYKEGKVEVQDEGSQVVSLLCNVKPGMHVVDLCAGAGGKALSLAAQMQNKGRLIACDVEPYRLKRAEERLRRAGVHNAQTHLLVPGDKWLKRQAGAFDCVVVDAPCSGMGVWRRNPDARWRMTIKSVQMFVEQQKDLLEKADHLLRNGGMLVYITCSLLLEENEDQIKAFLANYPHYVPVPVKDLWAQAGIKGTYTGDPHDAVLTPSTYGTDGFFFAALRKEV